MGRITKRVEASRDFYRDVLGFREVARPNFDFPGAWLYNYGIMIHLIYNEAAGDPDGEIEARDDHLALHCDDLARAERLLQEHGVEYRKNVIADRGITQTSAATPTATTSKSAPIRRRRRMCEEEGWGREAAGWRPQAGGRRLEAAARKTVLALIPLASCLPPVASRRVI